MRVAKSIQADLLLVIITFIWGSAFTIVKQSLAQTSPILFVSMRFWVAALVLTVCIPGKMRDIPGKTMLHGFLLSLVLFGGFIFQTLGLRSANPSKSAFITSLSVLLVPLLGFLLFRDRPGKQTLAGVLLATAGLFLMLAHTVDLRIGSGEALTLIGAVLFGVQILLVSRFVSAGGYQQLMLLQILGTAILSSLAIPLIEKPFIVWSAGLVGYIAIAGVFATALAFFVQGYAQRLTSANHAALVYSLEPFFAALFAFWILGQVMSAREWVGAILILAGILVSELRFAPHQK
jgi:drug/metabolite transporter (DMT)-like permease